MRRLATWPLFDGLRTRGRVAQAERLLQMAEKGFEYGVKTRLDVEDAELAVVQAKGNLARALRDSLVARATLKYATGVLDGREAAPADRSWTPAVSAAGLVGEVLRNEPSLPR